jgi:hypothetical protein
MPFYHKLAELKKANKFGANVIFVFPDSQETAQQILVSQNLSECYYSAGEQHL